MRALMDCSPPNILGMAWYDRATTYARGEAVFAYSHCCSRRSELNENCAAYGRTGYLPHPAGPRGWPITRSAAMCAGDPCQHRAVAGRRSVVGDPLADVARSDEALQHERKPCSRQAQRQP
ncbi:MAG: hypothetical protein R3F55_01460 [Alphaproteobacteria bacterium]